MVVYNDYVIILLSEFVHETYNNFDSVLNIKLTGKYWGNLIHIFTQIRIYYSQMHSLTAQKKFSDATCIYTNTALLVKQT